MYSLLRYGSQYINNLGESQLYNKGRCTNDVCSGRGGQPISDNRKGGCVDLVLTRGSKIPKVICERHQSKIYFKEQTPKYVLVQAVAF